MSHDNSWNFNYFDDLNNTTVGMLFSKPISVWLRPFPNGFAWRADTNIGGSIAWQLAAVCDTVLVA